MPLAWLRPAGCGCRPGSPGKAWGLELVRRPTGGRAILHGDELTYSVIGAENDPRLAGGVLESYCNLSLALLEALRLLGISVQALEKPLTQSVRDRQ